MDTMEGDGESIANRDEPIPVVRMPSDQDNPTLSEEEQQEELRTRDKWRQKIRDNFGNYSSTEGRQNLTQTLQDRVFASIMAQIIPSDIPDDGDEVVTQQEKKKKDRRSQKYVERPEFGPRLLAYNFRRFNARIGVVFVLQNMLIRLFTWSRPTSTLSFLAVYTLVCLQPHLLPLIPLVIMLLCVMVPSFLSRHPTPANDPRIAPSYHGPPTAPASRVRPAPDLSRDFWRNMRDLQNAMEDFSRIHDATNEFITPFANFSDEALSSTLYITLFIVSCTAFIASHLVPWTLIALVGGWTLVVLGHPKAQEVLLSSRNLSQLRQHVENIQTALREWVDNDIIMDEPAELRQVEIFELQRHHSGSDTWESWLFSPTPYDPLSQARLADARPKGTQFFEDVQPPAGWKWKEKKWTLDLLSREWVEERMITCVEIETQGERWVYDIPSEEVDLLDTIGQGKKKRVRSIPKSGWEEGTGLERRGKWRRRHWTRLVEKKQVASADKDAAR